MSFLPSNTHNTYKNLAYRPEIDGLRALAVLPVILFHAGFELFSGGFVGVDVFFVISGYLITSIILSEKQAGTFSIARFYERRARRILPALLCVTIVCVPFAWWWMPLTQLKNFFASIAAVLVFGSNIYFWRRSSYFDIAAEEKPLLHTWSLGVEEQYYLFFPLLLVFCWRLGPKRLGIFILFCALASFGISELIISRGKTEANFFLLPSRAWELFVGSLAALLSVYWCSKPSRWNNALSALGLTFILAAIFLCDKSIPFPGVYALLPTLGAALIILFATENTPVAKLLSLRLMTSIGLISYSAYLWHQPLFAFARIYYFETPRPLVFAILAVTSLVLAYLTQRFVETPFRHKEIIPRKQMMIACSSVTFALIALGLAGYLSGGFERTYKARFNAEQAELYQKLEDATATGDYTHMYTDHACKFWERAVTSSFVTRYQACHQKHGKSVLIIGDSHGMDLYNSLASVASTPFVVSIAQEGCHPFDAVPECEHAALDRFIAEHKDTIRVVIYSQSGGYFLTRNSRLPVNADFVGQTYDYLKRIAVSVPVLWLGPQAELLEDLRSVNVLRPKLIPHFKQDIGDVDAYLEALNRDHPAANITYRSKLALTHFEPGDLYYQGQFTYTNEDHWSTYGETVFGERMIKDKMIASYLLHEGK